MFTPIKLKLKQILGEEFVYKYAYFKRKLYLKLLRVICKFNFTAKLFTLFFTNGYDREIHSVIRGQILHFENKQGHESVNYFLRRGVHRLEKGLSMQPIRKVFGLDYIQQSVNAYKHSVESKDYSHMEELKWAHDVLSEYFRVCTYHPIIKKAEVTFQSVRHPDFAESKVIELSIPYAKSQAARHTVTYDEFYQLSLSRRSVRWYQDRAVPRQLIEQAILIASLSPSACNRQPFEFRIIDDSELLDKVRSLPMGVKGFEHNIPVMIAVVGKLRAYPEVRDRHVIYVDGGLASMSLMYAFETLGLSTCPINWPDILERESKAAKILSLNNDERIVMWLAVGYASEAGMIPKSEKVSLSHIRKYN